MNLEMSRGSVTEVLAEVIARRGFSSNIATGKEYGLESC